MKSVNILIKPASGRCNIACKYCFYHDVGEHRTTADFGLMNEETAEQLIDRAFDLDADIYTFVFQGGEPTLAGLPFFKRFVSSVRTRVAVSSTNRSTNPVRVQYSLQTNGIVLNDEWATFFKQEEFLLGVSIDGTRLLHDMYRVKKDGTGTYRTVMQGVDALRSAGVPVNALCVVDATIADNPVVVYRNLRSRGFDWIQFIPCINPFDDEQDSRPWTLSPAAYAGFLKNVFDLRYAEWRSGNQISIRWFDNLVAMAAGMPPETCGIVGLCSVNFTVEADGSVYPCDFYTLDEWRLGNVYSDSFDAMRESDVAHRFVESSSKVYESCRTCFAFQLCHGGCRRDREPFLNGEPRLNRYCSSFKEFFAYAGGRLMEMATIEKQARDVAGTL